MNTRNGYLIVAAIVLVTLVFSFAGVIFDFVMGLALDIDGLLLLSVSLMMVLIFAAMLYVLAKQAGWIGAKKSAEAAPAKPAGTSSTPASQN
jgi:hypothetical protein